MLKTKICNGCKRNLPASSFTVRKAYNSLHWICKSCDRQYSRKRYALGKCGRRKAGNIKPPNPKKKRAREILQYAVRSGKIVPKPCQVCRNKIVQGHHTDYSKPLDVSWYCRTHHMELHRKPDESVLIAQRIGEIEP